MNNNIATIGSDPSVNASIEIVASTITDPLRIISNDSILITLTTIDPRTSAIFELREALWCDVGNAGGENYPDRADIHGERDLIRVGLSERFVELNDGDKTGWEKEVVA